MAETHELRLKINAAAARAGAREFVAAISAIKRSIQELDRDSDGAFTRLKKHLTTATRGSRVKLNIVDRTSLRNLESYSRLAQQAVRSTANTSRSVTNLSGRMKALASSYSMARTNVDAMTASVNRLNTALGRQATLAATAAAGSSGAGAGTGGRVSPRGGGEHIAADQVKAQRALETTRLAVERLNTSLMRVGGFKTMNELNRAYGQFVRVASDSNRSATSLTTAMNAIRSAQTGAATSLVTLTTKARDATRAENAMAQATRDRTQALSAASASVNRASEETARLTNRLRAVGDTRGLEQLNAAMIRLRGQMTGSVGSIQQVRTATQAYNDVTSRLKVSLVGAEGAINRKARSARDAARQSNDAAGAVRRLEREMRSAAGAASAAERSFRGAAGGMRGLENAFSGSFQAASLFRTALGSLTLGTFTQSVFRAGDALEQFNITMEVASGSTQQAAADLAFINGIADELGTSLSASRDAFSKFAVASDIAGVSGDQTRMIFESVSTAMAVLGRGTEDQRLAFLALEQMMSKGVVSAEELRRQLGERMPGAVAMMAEALGVGVGELQNMLKAGEVLSNDALPKFAAVIDRRFGSQISRTFNRAGSNLGRLSNEFTRLAETIAGAGFLDELSIQFRDITSVLRSGDVQDAARAIGRGLADATRIAGEGIIWLIQNIEEVGRVVRNIIGGVVLASFARFGAAILVAGQQMAVAVTAFRGLGAASAAITPQLAKAGAAAGLSAQQLVKMQAGMTGAAAAGGKLASRMGLVARGFSFLGGPVGVLIGALSLAPMAFSAFGDSAQEAATNYTQAFRDMEVSTFRFYDRVRDRAEESQFINIQQTTNDFNRARDLLDQFRADVGAQDTGANILGDIADGSISLRPLVAEITELQSKLLDASTPFDEMVAATTQLKETMVELRGAIPEDQARALEEALLPAAAAVQAMQDHMITLDKLTDGNARTMLELRDATNEARAEVTAVFDGLSAVGSTEINPELRALLESTETGNFTRALEILENTLLQMPQASDALKDDLQALIGALEAGEISVEQFAQGFSALRPRIDEAADATSRLNPLFAETADLAIIAADDTEVLSDALVNAQYAADGAAAASNGAAQGFANAGNAASGAAGQIASYTQALLTAQGLTAEVQGLANDFVADAELRIEIANIDDPLQRAIAQDLNFGGTARALEDVDERISNIRSEIQTTASEVAHAPIGLMDGINAELRSAEEERSRIIAAGEGAVTAQFAQRSRRSGGGGGGGGGRRRSGGGGGGGSSRRSELSEAEKLAEAMEKYNAVAQEQVLAQQLLQDGSVQTAEAAEFMAQAMRLGIDIADEDVAAKFRQIDAANQLKEAMEELANDPVNDWMESVASWREAGQQIETQVFDSLGDAISNFIKTGEFSFEDLGASILATAADIISDMAVQEMVSMLGGNVSGTGEGGFGLGGIFSDLFANNSIGQTEGDPFAAGSGVDHAALQNALVTGGQQAAEFIRQAMTAGGAAAQGQVTAGGAQAGQLQSQGIVQGAQQASSINSGSIVQGASQAAPILSSATSTGAVTGAPFLQQGIEMGSQTGGGIFSQMLGGLFGGGGGGGGFGGLFGAVIPALFGDGGGTTSGGPSMPSVMAPAAMFKGAPSYAMGTPNTSGGTPAILHNNEAVVPLSGGRKIPIEGGDFTGGGGKTIVQNFNITTPDADSFRKSQTQIAADAAASGQRALSRNR